MIWLASFPRSGNTFFRNVLYEVYGIESSTYHQDSKRKLDKNFQNFQVIKTHELPNLLPKKIRNCPSVYIIRDGRDSLVSMAHHRKDIVEPGSDFYNNLLLSLLPQYGSFFGGWSENVKQWTAKADIIIKFTDLIEDPLREIEKLRSIMDLPEPNREKLPNFKSLKFGNPKYGGGKGKRFSGPRAKLHFRKGKVGSWKEEFPPNLEKLLWAGNGAMLEKWGYGKPSFEKPLVTKTVFIEVSKLYGKGNDGVKRYLSELISGLTMILPFFPEWNVVMFYGKNIKPLVKRKLLAADDKQSKAESDNIETDSQDNPLALGYENKLLAIKRIVKANMPSRLYSWFSDYYAKGPFRQYLTKLRSGILQGMFTTVSPDFLKELNEDDLIHIPLPQHMPMKGLEDITAKKLVTVHDLTHQLFPQFHTPANIQLAELGMKLINDQNADVIAVSKSTKNDIQNHTEIPDDRVHLCYEGVSEGLFNPYKKKDNIDWILKKYKIPKGPYLMCLSTIEPRKNIKNTLLAFLELKKENPDWDLKILVCGKKGWKTEDVFKDAKLDHPDIIFTGFIDDLDLPYIYANAIALCYISHYEGFGLPIIEAMYCKTPVLYGNNSSMPEVAGEGGIAVDSNDINDIKEKMYEIVSNKELIEERSKAAYFQACKFSWLKMAVDTLEIYDKIISKK